VVSFALAVAALLVIGHYRRKWMRQRLLRRMNHRPCKARPRHAALLTQRANRRRATRGAVCRRLQLALAAARNRPPGPEACIFYPRAAALARQCHAASMAPASRPLPTGEPPLADRPRPRLRSSRKLNFAGPTRYFIRVRHSAPGAASQIRYGRHPSWNPAGGASSASTARVVPCR
jgi:hypothetical protein